MTKKRKRPSLKKKIDEAGYIFELKCTQEVLNKEGYGNTMRRYLDDRLRKELNYPPKGQLHYIKRIKSIMDTNLKWDSTTQSFIVYHCRKHNFHPDMRRLQSECFQRNCTHLHVQRKKEIIVKTLNEALTLKQNIGNLRIEQVPTGFKVAAL